MAQQPKKPDLANLGMTTSQYLLFTSPTYSGQARLEGSPEGIAAGAAIVPIDPEDLEVAVKGSKSFEGPNTASVSFGNDMFKLAKKFEQGEQGELGLKTTDTGEAQFGPLTGYYRQSMQPGNQDLQNKSFGVNAGFGPVKLYADRKTSSQDVIPEEYVKYFDTTRSDSKTDTLGGSVGIGPLNLNLSREFGTRRGPKSKFEDTRPMGQSPNVTRFGAGFEGEVGPGTLSVGGNLTDVRGVGTESSLGGSYNVRNPFGLGGNLRATGSYNNPIGGESAAQALINFKMRF